MAAILNATFNETRKGLLLIWAYKTNTLFTLVTISLGFLGISYVIGDGKPSASRMASALVGFLIWYYYVLITDNMAENLTSEARYGTLEQMFISPIPIGFILIGRLFATLLISSAQLLLIGAVMIIWLNLPLHWSVDAIPVAIISLIGLFGFGFMLSGAALVLKQIDSIISIVNYVLVFLNGALVAVDQFPAWLLVFARLLPSTLSIIVMRSILLNGRTLQDVWYDGSLPQLIVHSIVYLIGGWIILKWSIRIAKNQGSLGQY